MNREKLALVFHGWPQELGENHSLLKILLRHKYTVIKPYILNMVEEINLENILNKVNEELGGKAPDVIVGMSMSGFWLPYVAKKFPKAKIIAVATAARFAPKVKLFANFTKILALPILGEMFAWVILKVAPIYMKWWFKQLTSNGKSGKYVQEDIDRSVSDLRKINFRKHCELIRMILPMNNLKIWSKLKNKTLVLSGSEDIVMPMNLGKEIATAVKNSQIFVTKRSHFDVLNRETYQVIETFV